MSALDLAALKRRAEAAAEADLANGGWQGGPERNPATLLQLIARLERAERRLKSNCARHNGNCECIGMGCSCRCTCGAEERP